MLTESVAGTNLPGQSKKITPDTKDDDASSQKTDPDL